MVVPAKKIFLFSLLVIGALLAIDLILQAVRFSSQNFVLIDLIDRFNVDNEASIPTWLSQTILLVCALLAGGIAHKQQSQDKKLRWGGIAVILLILSIDEGASLHETFGVWIGQIFGAGIDLGLFTLRDWVLLSLIVIIAVTIFYLPFLWKLPHTTRNWLIAGGVLFIFGAGIWESLHFTAFGFDHATVSFAASLSNAVEEGCELVGSAFILYAFLRQLEQQSAKLTFSFQK